MLADMAKRLHSRAKIARVLGERDAHGWSYAETSRRTGIPTGTLASWARRLRQERRRSSPQFVEVVAAADPGGESAPGERSAHVSSARIAHPSGMMIELEGEAAMRVAQGILAALGSCR